MSTSPRQSRPKTTRKKASRAPAVKKKTTTRKKSKTTATKKSTSKKKTPSKKKSTAKKKTTAKKKPSRKKAAGGKAASKPSAKPVDDVRHYGAAADAPDRFSPSRSNGTAAHAAQPGWLGRFKDFVRRLYDE